MLDSFNISLIINGTINDVTELNSLQKYGKTIYLKKGERINSKADPAEQDFFKFTYIFTENHEKDLKEFSDLIKNINLKKYEKCDVKLRIYIQSFDAFILIPLSKEMITTLQELGLDVEISILSWGEVTDDNVE